MFVYFFPLFFEVRDSRWEFHSPSFALKKIRQFFVRAASNENLKDSYAIPARI
jgi:hypothetical protein